MFWASGIKILAKNTGSLVKNILLHDPEDNHLPIVPSSYVIRMTDPRDESDAHISKTATTFLRPNLFYNKIKQLKSLKDTKEMLVGNFETRPLRLHNMTS